MARHRWEGPLTIARLAGARAETCLTRATIGFKVMATAPFGGRRAFFGLDLGHDGRRDEVMCPSGEPGLTPYR